MKMSRAIHPTSWGDRVEAGTLARRRSLSTVSASNVDEPFGDPHPDQSQGVFTKQSRRLYSPLHMVRMLQIRYAGLRIRLQDERTIDPPIPGPEYGKTKAELSRGGRSCHKQ